MARMSRILELVLHGGSEPERPHQATPSGPDLILNWTREFIRSAPAIVDADEVGAEAGLEAVRKGLPVIRTTNGIRYCWISLGQFHGWLVRRYKARMTMQQLAVWASEAGWERGTFHVGTIAKRIWRFPWHE